MNFDIPTSSGPAEVAEANLKVVKDTYAKRFAIHLTSPTAISQDELYTDNDAVMQAQAALDLANKQNDLTKAGAWSYDLANEEKQYAGLKQASDAANALLAKYTVKANQDGVVLSINATVGSYVSSQGAYNTYTQASDPLIVMGTPQDTLAVRCYVDEILVSRLSAPNQVQAQMSIRGSDLKVPLEFVRVQPYVSPKIELSSERREQVDLLVLPLIFRFQKKDRPVFQGQEVDVYITKSPQPSQTVSTAVSASDDQGKTP